MNLVKYIIVFGALLLDLSQVHSMKPKAPLDLEFQMKPGCLEALVNNNGSTVFEPLKKYLTQKDKKGKNRNVLVFPGRAKGTFWTIFPWSDSEVSAQLEGVQATINMNVLDVYNAIRTGHTTEVLYDNKNNLIKVEGGELRPDFALMHWTTRSSETSNLDHFLDNSEDLTLHEDVFMENFLRVVGAPVPGASLVANSDNLLALWSLYQFARHPSGHRLILNLTEPGDFEDGIRRATELGEKEESEARKFVFGQMVASLENLSVAHDLYASWGDANGKMNEGKIAPKFWGDFFSLEESKELKSKIKFTKKMEEYLLGLPKDKQLVMKNFLTTLAKDDSNLHIEPVHYLELPFSVLKLYCNCKGENKRVLYIKGGGGLKYVFLVFHRNVEYSTGILNGIKGLAKKARRELEKEGLL